MAHLLPRSPEAGAASNAVSVTLQRALKILMECTWQEGAGAKLMGIKVCLHPLTRQGPGMRPVGRCSGGHEANHKGRGKGLRLVGQILYAMGFHHDPKLLMYLLAHCRVQHVPKLNKA